MIYKQSLNRNQPDQLITAARHAWRIFSQNRFKVSFDILIVKRGTSQTLLLQIPVACQVSIHLLVSHFST